MTFCLLTIETNYNWNFHHLYASNTTSDQLLPSLLFSSLTLLGTSMYLMPFALRLHDAFGVDIWPQKKHKRSILMQASDRLLLRYFLFDIVPLLVRWLAKWAGWFDCWTTASLLTAHSIPHCVRNAYALHACEDGSLTLGLRIHLWPKIGMAKATMFP